MCYCNAKQGIAPHCTLTVVNSRVESAEVKIVCRKLKLYDRLNIEIFFPLVVLLN